MQDFKKLASKNLRKIRKKNPLVHNITNYVVMNFTANVLLASGASPVMAHALEEVEEMVLLANALVLNIGTLSEEWVLAMIKAGKVANNNNIPVVFDPVGVGATKLRTNTAKRILREVKVSIVRANASEILSLSNNNVATKGVDSLHTIESNIGMVVELSKTFATTLAITGKIDIVTDGDGVLKIENGHYLMKSVTGTGCSASAIIAAFAAVESDTLVAAASGLAFWGIAGEKAAQKTLSPGSFQVYLIDSLYETSEEELQNNAQISQVYL